MFKQWLSSSLKNNNERIIVIGLVVLFVLIILIAFNKMSSSKTNVSENTIKNVYTPSETVIAGSSISEKEYKKNESIVKQFVDYCNTGKYEEAYNLLTDECKEVLYPNIDKFITLYINPIFNTYKEFNLKSWINEGNYKIYKIRYIEDALSSGNYTESEKIEDYITVVEIGETQKLSINSYVGRNEINKQTKTDELDFLVETADIYIEKIVYKLKVKNKTEKEIQLDGFMDSQILIGLSVNGIVHKANRYKLNEIKLSVGSKLEKEIELEFGNSLSKGELGDQILFYDIILDAEKFRENQEEYNISTKIVVSL